MDPVRGASAGVALLPVCWETVEIRKSCVAGCSVAEALPQAQAPTMCLARRLSWGCPRAWKQGGQVWSWKLKSSLMPLSGGSAGLASHIGGGRLRVARDTQRMLRRHSSADAAT
jgi:hypothetical protein